MYNTIFEMLDVKPCSLTCAEGPFVIVIDCITPNCTVSSLKPITEVLASTPGFCELVQDCIGDALEGFDYADGVNAWIQENPLSTALNISYDNSVSLLTATTVQGAIDEIVAGFCLSVSNCLVDNGLPANLDIFLLNGLQTVVGGTYDYELSSTDNIMSLLLNGSVVDTATIVNSNDLSNTGLVITSDVNGVVDSIDITSDVQALIASNTDSVTNTVTGFRVATHTAVDTTAVDINVPIATITPSTNGYTYTAIDNSTKAIVYDVIDQGTNNPKLTITVDGTLVKTIDLNQNDIQIDNAGSDFDLVDDILTFLETNGDSATISFAKYNVTVTVQPNGDQLIYQNGNLLATVYKNAADINYDNTTSGLTATNVQTAIDELSTAQRPFVKIGNTSETSATDVLSTDDIFHQGKVSLGNTSAPGADLHVKKANNGATEIITENTNTTISDYADNVILNGDIRTTIGSYKAGGYGYTGTESNNDFYIYANNNTAIVVQPNGHVGIGNAVNVPLIDDVLYVDSGVANDSGITMEKLTSASPTTVGAGAIGVNANGKIVRVDIPTDLSNLTCSGNVVSATNKIITTDSLTSNVTVPTTVVATPDPTTTPYAKAVKVNTGCNEDVYVPQVPVQANNGLDKDGVNIVLGQDIGEAGDPAKLLSNREIPMDGKNLQFKASNGDVTYFNGTNGNIDVGGSDVTINANKSNDIGTLEKSGFLGDLSGLRQKERTGRNPNGQSVGTIYENVTFEYPENIGGGTAHYQRTHTSQWKRTGSTWEHVIALQSKDGLYYLGDGVGDNGRTTASTTTLPPTLSTSTTEPMAIDTATGQIGRMPATVFGAGFMNTAIYAPTGTIMSTIILNNPIAGIAYFDFNQDVVNNSGSLDYAFIEILVNGTVAFPSFTQNTSIGTIFNGASSEYQFQRADFITLPAGNCTIEAKLYSNSGGIIGQNQGRFKVFRI